MCAYAVPNRHNRGLSWLLDDCGATAIEYGLIAALIAVVIVVAVTAVGTQLSSTFNSVASTL